jgi:hypothetical protein
LVHADLEGHASSRGGFLKDHAQSFSFEQGVFDAVLHFLFQLGRQAEYFLHFRRG